VHPAHAAWVQFARLIADRRHAARCSLCCDASSVAGEHALARLRSWGKHAKPQAGSRCPDNLVEMHDADYVS
jgi:hypothetical protein